MSENSKVEAAQLGSEKSKDIRQTNIIAAKGKSNSNWADCLRLETHNTDRVSF